MKYIYLLALILFCQLSKGQSNPTIPTNDSLLRYCGRLESNQKIIVKALHGSGKDIETGIGFIGGGIIASVAGGVLAAVAPSAIVYDANGRAVGTRLSAAQIGGILLGTFGFSCNIVGIIKIGQGGRKLRDL